MAEDYKFPDESEKVEATIADDIKVEVIDDTPPEDRGRQPLPKNIVEELDNDDLEEYSDKVKKRLSQMKKVWHDERREKERASREREEAIRFAQQAYEENKVLKQRIGAGEHILAQEFTKSATNDIGTARDRLKQAYESGDVEKIAEAQEALTDAKLRMKDVERFKPSLQNQQPRVQQPQQVQAPPVAPPDQKAEMWREKNQWFGVDEEMTALALGLHEKLVRSGVDPRSDDYYRRVDETMRKRFSDYFDGDASETREERPSPRKSATTVVAPATRSTAPRQVRLTPSQVALAKKLGLTNEAYARELMKLENSNG
jgi:hypothetical protein